MTDYGLDKTISLWDEQDRRGVTLKEIETGKSYSFILRNSYVVGRKADICDLQITETDRYISGRHLRFMMEGNEIYIEDLHSKNGTRLNGRLITSKTRIRKGDRLRIGRTEFEVTF